MVTDPEQSSTRGRSAVAGKCQTTTRRAQKAAGEIGPKDSHGEFARHFVRPVSLPKFNADSSWARIIILVACHSTYATRACILLGLEKGMHTRSGVPVSMPLASEPPAAGASTSRCPKTPLWWIYHVQGTKKVTPSIAAACHKKGGACKKRINRGSRSARLSRIIGSVYLCTRGRRQPEGEDTENAPLCRTSSRLIRRSYGSHSTSAVTWPVESPLVTSYDSDRSSCAAVPGRNRGQIDSRSLAGLPCEKRRAWSCGGEGRKGALLLPVDYASACGACVGDCIRDSSTPCKLFSSCAWRVSVCVRTEVIGIWVNL